ncbi:hypothetical protein H5410_022338 [Solanum commersonii]|uniref:Uncharacterized protein n=1 Tax=Solanum commersonii TaxID=4109 RepID=A0A9J5ZDX0_SOLCO|nr:hypothetical protein H5410_022338 [Solanum commersonii]
MMLHKSMGGLDIKNLKEQHESLRRIWLWRYISKERAIWKEVIVAKYGELNPWVSETVSMPFGLGSLEVHQSSVGLNGRRTDSKGGESHQSQVLEDVWISQSSR